MCLPSAMPAMSKQDSPQHTVDRQWSRTGTANSPRSTSALNRNRRPAAPDGTAAHFGPSTAGAICPPRPSPRLQSSLACAGPVGRFHSVSTAIERRLLSARPHRPNATPAPNEPARPGQPARGAPHIVVSALAALPGSRSPARIRAVARPCGTHRAPLTRSPARTCSGPHPATRMVSLEQPRPSKGPLPPQTSAGRPDAALRSATAAQGPHPPGAACSRCPAAPHCGGSSAGPGRSRGPAAPHRRLQPAGAE